MLTNASEIDLSDSEKVLKYKKYFLNGNGDWRGETGNFFFTLLDDEVIPYAIKGLINAIEESNSKITKLGVYRGNIRGEGATAIIKAAGNPIDVTLSACRIRSGDMKDLGKELADLPLKFLNLEYNFICEGLHYLAPLLNNNTLRLLNLAQITIDDRDLAKLFTNVDRNASLTKLKYMALSSNNLGLYDDYKDWMKFLNRLPLRLLFLDHNHLDAKQSIYLLENIPPSLETLDLSKNYLGSSPLTNDFFKALNKTNISNLHLRDCGLDNSGLLYLLKNAEDTKLNFVALGKNKITGDVFFQMRDLLMKTNIEEISFQKIPFKLEEILSLVNALKETPLKLVDLFECLENTEDEDYVKDYIEALNLPITFIFNDDDIRDHDNSALADEENEALRKIYGDESSEELSEASADESQNPSNDSEEVRTSQREGSLSRSLSLTDSFSDLSSSKEKIRPNEVLFFKSEPISAKNDQDQDNVKKPL